MLNLLRNRSHCAKFQGVVSFFAFINTSDIQGYGLGPTDSVIAISDLWPISKCNRIFKYAYDCYLAVPASSITITEIELEHINLQATAVSLLRYYSRATGVTSLNPLFL